MKRIPRQIGGLLLALLLGGCVVAPRSAYYEPYHREAVLVAPPAPLVEVIGMPPYAGHIWISGAWFWEGGRHHWRPGHWEAPRHGHAWVPHRWEHNGRHWHFNKGHWNRHH